MFNSKSVKSRECFSIVFGMEWSRSDQSFTEIATKTLCPKSIVYVGRSRDIIIEQCSERGNSVRKLRSRDIHILNVQYIIRERVDCANASAMCEEMRVLVP